jgi:predicted nucleic acid-binding protein
MTGVTFDAGALIALRRGQKRMIALLDTAMRTQQVVSIPAGVLAQVWRGGGRQARIARLLSARETEVVALDELTARATGVLSGACGHADVVDVSVALCARERQTPLVTSDPDDLRRVEPSLELLEI